ncbi:MAG TPA: RsmD family RNA methyltransferase [Burkholderiaceae bacterium]|nr:RsmD family RNA methyltransferase [Burkholderiaceae bacterium]
MPVPNAPGLLPTPDRVRETLFNWLAHLLPDLSHVQGLDLFAGTGALGFELASRGAARVILIEQNAQLAKQLIQSKARLGATHLQIMQGNALSVAPSLPAAAFHVVFIDPPYGAGLTDTALTLARRLLHPDGLIYLEAAQALSPAQCADHALRLVRTGRAGAVHFHLLAPEAAPTATPNAHTDHR